MILNSANRIETFTERGWWGMETLDSIFLRTVAQFPDAVAVVDPLNRADISDGQPQQLTYKQLNAAVDRLATVLLQHDIRKDDIIAAQLPNTIELVMLYLATARIGAIVSPFPAQYREHELEQIVNFLEAKTLLTTTRIGKQQHAAMVAAMHDKLPTLTSVMAFGENVPEGVLSLDQLMAAPYDGSILTNYLHTTTTSANDVVTICWTSGTESRPKGVPRSHNEWLVIGMAMADAANLEQGCSILNPFPLVSMAGIGGMFMSWLLTGGKFVQHHPLSLPVFLKQIAVERINFTVVPPALLNMLLQNEVLLAQADISSIKTLGSGSAPLSPWMVKTWQDKHNIYVVNFFGSNEGTTLISGPKEIPDPELRALYFPRFGVEGYNWPARIAPMMQTKLVDLQTGEIITGPGIPGELLIKGAAVFGGYYHDEQLTAHAFDDEGYFRTGDVFELAGEGDSLSYYRFVGRSKDIIIRGGFNISAEEVEGLIQGHPKVAEVAIVGYAHTTLGECACACIVPRPDETVTLEDIVLYLTDKKIAVYKLPERLLLLPALPRNPLGKVLKNQLRKQAKEEVTV